METEALWMQEWLGTLHGTGIEARTARCVPLNRSRCLVRGIVKQCVAKTPEAAIRKKTEKLDVTLMILALASS